MAKILIVDGGVPFHGVGGTLNHSYAELAQKTLTAMGHEVTISRVDGKWQAAEEADKFKAADAVPLGGWERLGKSSNISMKCFAPVFPWAATDAPVPIQRITTVAAVCSPTRSTCFPSRGMRR